MTPQSRETLDEGTFKGSPAYRLGKTSSLSHLLGSLEEEDTADTSRVSPVAEVLQASGQSSPRRSNAHDEDTCLPSYFKDLPSKTLDCLMGEISFQLTCRILSYVFQDQTKICGFSLKNINEKICEITTHPVTGRVDELYHKELTKRYCQLTKNLQKLGYSVTWHPDFMESIIHTYGFLNHSIRDQMVQELRTNEYNILRLLIIKRVPAKMVKDMLCLVSCLSFMATMDGRPLLPMT